MRIVKITEKTVQFGSAIAFFVLAGNLMTKGGISRRIVRFANCLVGNVRGGMSLALVLACAFFAALSGSAPATVIAIGTMLYADMVDLGYPGDRTAGCFRRPWSDHPAVYHYGYLLYIDWRIGQQHVHAGHDDRYCYCTGSDGGSDFLCP